MVNIDQQVPGVVVIMFMVWVAVNIGLPKKFAPLLGWITGIIIAYFTYGKANLLEVVYYGPFLAASAVGFHSGSKNTLENFRNNNNNNNINNNIKNINTKSNHKANTTTTK